MAKIIASCLALQENLKSVFTTYTPSNQIDLIKAKAGTPQKMLEPVTFSERILNALGRESARQSSLRILIEQSRDKLETACATNQDINSHTRHLVDRFVAQHFHPSPNL